MVELLVALAIGLFVVGGILQVLVSSRASYRLAEGQARVQENGRYAAQVLAKDMRGSRGTGCSSIVLEEARQTLNVWACDLLNAPASDPCAGTHALGSRLPIGYDDAQNTSGSTTWLAGLPGNSGLGAEQTVRSQWLRGDVLVAWGVFGDATYVASPGSIEAFDAAGTRTLSGPVDLVAPNDLLYGGRLALITDCEATDIFEITTPTTCQDKEQTIPTALQHSLNFDADGNPTDTCAGTPAAGYVDKSSDKVNTSANLARAYNRRGSDASPGTTIRARVFPFEYKVFYVCCVDTRDGTIQSGGATANCGTAPARYRPAICRWSTSDCPACAQQLVLDVADMRVVYDGVLDAAAELARDEDFDATTTARFSDLAANPDAKWVNDFGYWNRVDSAKVQLLATSMETVRSAPALPTAAIVGAAAASGIGSGLPADRRIYELFEVTVAARAISPWYVRQ